MRRLFGSRGIGSRQGDLLSEEAAERRASDEDMDFLAAYGKAEKQGARRKKKECPRKRSWGEAKGAGQTLNSSNRKTGLRNR